MYRHVVAVLVMLIVVVLVTTHYLTYNTTTGRENHHCQGIWGIKRHFSLRGWVDTQCKSVFRWNSEVGTQWASPPISLSENVHPHRGHQVKRVWLQNLPRSLAAIARERCPGRGSHHRTVNTWGHLRRDNGDIPSGIPTKEKTGRSTLFQDIAEEPHIEILETLKECLWCRWDPTQLEEPRWRSTGTRTTRTPAQVKFHTQMQATYDHFGNFWDRQQESGEEALRVARNAQCWVLATVAML